MRAMNVNTGRPSTHVTPQKYYPVREAILKTLPDDEKGMACEELTKAIAPHLSRDLFPHMGSVRWYAKTVQLDLEARGLIERIPKSKPLRLRRVAGPLADRPEDR